MQRPKETLASAWKSITRANKRSGFHPIEDDRWQPSGANPGAIELGPLSSSPSYAEFRDKQTLRSRTSFATTKSSPATPKRKLIQDGWRFGAVNCAFSVTVVFLLNLSVTAWGTAHKNTGQEVIFEDECEKVSRLNTWLHLLINLLSTILLSASNYCMQCLSAPTRSEVDKAHAKGSWLDIGIPSTRNLRFISKRRAIVWAILGLSSLPLHLFYNSMVYSSIASHDYLALNVPEAFKNDQDCLNCDAIPDGPYSLSQYKARDITKSLHGKARNNELTRLEPRDCINEYAKMIQSYRRNVLLVGSDDSFPPTDSERTSFIAQSLFNDTRVYELSRFVSGAARSSGSGAIDAYEWICQKTNETALPNGYCQSHVDEVKNEPEWRVNGFKVDYCLSETAPPLCKLHILLPVGWLVTCLNLLKALLIYYTAFMIKDQPMMTMGDAVASFMERPDPRTKNSCLLTMKDVKKQPKFTPAGPKSWRVKTGRWKDVTSKTRRITTITMFMIALIIVSALLGLGVGAIKQNEQSTSLQALARIGFGAIDPRTIISWDIIDTMKNILVANLAQPILSFLYFSYNGLFTCMLLGFEWSQYAHERKGLRVSMARSGAQRSTYFLQLPYRYSLPLMGLSGLLHWLVSQSIFIVAIDLYGADGGIDIFGETNFMSCGYSPIAIISVLVLGIIMVIAGLGFGYIPYRPGMSLAGSCSLAMSAACHAEDWDLTDGHDAARAKLQWGVVGEGDDGVGHCAFSARDVKFPEDGKTYARG